jgi:hypothetical protein
MTERQHTSVKLIKEASNFLAFTFFSRVVWAQFAGNFVS